MQSESLLKLKKLLLGDFFRKLFVFRRKFKKPVLNFFVARNFFKCLCCKKNFFNTKCSSAAVIQSESSLESNTLLLGTLFYNWSSFYRNLENSFTDRAQIRTRTVDALAIISFQIIITFLDFFICTC